MITLERQTTLADGELQDRLLAYCSFLSSSSVYLDDPGCSVWPWVEGEHRKQCGVCTHGAQLVAEKFGGKVVGYSVHPHDDPDLVGRGCFGHDFAVVGPYLVDWWGRDYEEGIPRPVLHLEEDAELIRRKYKPESEWREINE